MRLESERRATSDFEFNLASDLRAAYFEPEARVGGEKLGQIISVGMIAQVCAQEGRKLRGW